jgi:hypothetical protein
LPGVHYYPNFISNHQALHDDLIDESNYIDRSLPFTKLRGHSLNRSRAYFAPRGRYPCYRFTGFQYGAFNEYRWFEDSPLLEAARVELNTKLDLDTNFLIVTKYGDQDDIDWHSDSTKDWVPGTGFSIVTLGGKREFQIRNAGEKKPIKAFSPEPGSLLTFTAHANSIYEHSTVKGNDGDPHRISLGFRNIATHLSYDDIQKKLQASQRQKEKAQGNATAASPAAPDYRIELPG